MIICATSNEAKRPFVSLWINPRAELQNRSMIIVVALKVFAILRFLLLCSVITSSLFVIVMAVQDLDRVSEPIEWGI